MSVIVKGMQMPKACMLCPIYNGEYGECGVLHDRYLFPFLSEDTYRYDATKEIHKDCPLVERPQGEWVFRQGVTCVGYYKCNKCGEVERAEKNFCPNCGAKMKGGAKDGMDNRT